MATRSIIAAEFDAEMGGNIVATYCHYDGYLQGVGTTLLRNFNDSESAFAISDMGYLSSLYDSVEENADPEKFGERAHANDDEPNYFEDLADIEANMTNYGAEFAYVFKDGKWFVFDRYDNPNWVLLDRTAAAATH
jgi:hypothetical protein